MNDLFTQRVVISAQTPQNLNVDAETISLISPDNILLKAWWIPSAKERERGIVILLHGMMRTDASVMLGHARFLLEAGYATLALDMRAHGRSGGRRLGMTIDEPQDVITAVEWIKAQPQLTDLPIVVLGFSSGGAIALRTAAIRSDIDAVITVSAFASLPHMFRQTLSGSTDIPDPTLNIFTPLLHLTFFTIYGEWPSRASPIRVMTKILPRPILVIHSEKDSRFPLHHAEQLLIASDGQAEFWVLQNTDDSTMTDQVSSEEGSEYQRRILDFLDKSISRVSMGNKIE
jgi:dipeptidyl aminopeptidase/acylaminoacyl peptidase